jgi:hypothetical protein
MRLPQDSVKTYIITNLNHVQCFVKKEQEYLFAKKDIYSIIEKNIDLVILRKLEKIMKKYMKYSNVLIFGFMITTSLSASQDRAFQKEYTFYITISEQDNPIKTDSNGIFDRTDKFSCDILNLLWPEKDGERLWRIEETEHTTTGDPKRYIGPMSISDFSNNISANPHYKKQLEKCFKFPDALSDATVKKLVEKKVEEENVTYEVETGTIVHLILKNNQESLQKLGLITAKMPNKTLTKAQDTTATKTTKFILDTSIKPNTKSSNSFIPYIFVGSIAGLSIIAYLLKTLS